MTALIGLEPITTRVEDECSIQLSYKALNYLIILK